MATHYVFDIEADGLNELKINKKKEVCPECTRVHLLVLRELGKGGEVKVYRRNDEMDTIREGFNELMSADSIIGNNIVAYDLPVLHRLIGTDVTTEPKVLDTLVMARTLWPDAQNHPFGGNSLEDFGKLLKCAKGDFDGPWDRWSQTMEDYCIQDTAVSEKIFWYLKPKIQQITTPFKIETEVAKLIAGQQANGVRIALDEAEELIEHLELEHAQAMDELQEAFPPIIETMKTPQYYTLTVDGQEYIGETKKELGEVLKANGHKKSWASKAEPGPLKTREHPFSATTHQIAARFKDKYGYEAPETDAGNPTLPEDTLKMLDYPEATFILKAQMADKRLQHLSDWVKRARNSRTPGVIHPQINSNGAATGRMTHQQPNQTACPKVVCGPDGVPLMGFEGRYGWQCRNLWRPTQDGWFMVGGDASGLELRMLGNRMARYDGGKYLDIVINGDVHTLNMEAGGLLTRDQSKTAMYALLYGSGDENLGVQIATHPSLSPEQLKKYKGKSAKSIGKAFRRKIEKSIPALKKLSEFCRQAASSNGFITLLDGRNAPIRSPHKAMNTLLQGDGAIVMKLALIIHASHLRQRGWLWTRAAYMLNAHDEFQLEAEAVVAEEVGQLIVSSIEEAGKRLKCKCPLTGEYKIGRSWADTH